MQSITIKGAFTEKVGLPGTCHILSASMLVPYLKVKKQTAVISMLQEIKRLPMQINWDEIVEFQVRCLQAGANGVGIPDLIIAQNARENNCKIYSAEIARLLDKPQGLIRWYLYLDPMWDFFRDDERFNVLIRPRNLDEARQ